MTSYLSTSAPQYIRQQPTDLRHSKYPHPKECLLSSAFFWGSLAYPAGNVKPADVRTRSIGVYVRVPFSSIGAPHPLRLPCRLTATKCTEQSRSAVKKQPPTESRSVCGLYHGLGYAVFTATVIDDMCRANATSYVMNDNTPEKQSQYL